MDSSLHLSSVNLRGGELRRRSAADEFAMRDYLKEGDLISAEVQQVKNLFFFKLFNYNTQVAAKITFVVILS